MGADVLSCAIVALALILPLTIAIVVVSRRARQAARERRTYQGESASHARMRRERDDAA